MTLNEKCTSILEYLRSRAGDIPPTVREICKGTGISSTSCVHRYLCQLTEKGLVEKVNSGSRGYRVSGSEARMVPLIGRVTAGVPILAVEETTDMMAIPFSDMSGELFALRVQGESMKNAAILDGDIIVARRADTADNGQIVVALIDDEATVKRFFMEPDGMVRLQPENEAFEPIYSDHAEILGIVTAVMRRYR